MATEGEVCAAMNAGVSGVIVTDKTPFYAEMGGQAGDKGIIKTASAKAKVVDTKKTGDGIYLHFVEMLEGTISSEDKVTLEVCKVNRMAVCRNHSTTHLLHKALKEVLGVHVAQAGSEVNANHLRFDFSHFEAMTADEIKEVENKVNAAIMEAMPIEVKELPIEEAKKLGATAQFGEKYGDEVRVVTMGDYSLEFCGGTHLTNTAQAGLFKILSEAGVAAGTRRIEAITGMGVMEYINRKESLIAKTADVIKSNVNEIDVKAEKLVAELKDANRQIESMRAKLAQNAANDIMDNAKVVDGIKIITGKNDMDMNEIIVSAEQIRDKAAEPTVVVLCGIKDDKISFICMANKDAVAAGVKAGNIIKNITAIAGGSGGGKPDMARGGGKDASKVDEALEAVANYIK